jgi:multiple sugar transport system ATP-binding protein
MASSLLFISQFNYVGMSMATVALNNISKSFDDTQVLCNINLAIEDREFIVFVGPSGCGKTTLLRIIAGLEEATEGQVFIDGKDVSTAHPVDRGISMVFQSYALYPHLTVFENIAFPLRVAKVPEVELNERVENAANILQLTNRLQHKPGQLSGGQRQRVAIGRSIVRNPKVFLFDEPLSNLDAALRGDMRVELATLHQDLKATMIYVTHDQVEAMTMADKIVVLNGGNIEQYGTPMEVYHHPKTQFVAGFIGQPNMNFIAAIRTSSDENSCSIEADGLGPMTLPVSASVGQPNDVLCLGIRPEDLMLASSDQGFNMYVKVLERLGGSAIAYGTINSQSNGEQPFRAVLPGDVQVIPGQQLHLQVDPNKCHLFDEQGNAMRRLKAEV